MKEIIKLVKAIEKKLNLKPCTEEELSKSISETLHLTTNDDLLNAMNEFINGKIIFNCDGGEGDYYYYIENNKIMYFTPDSIEDELTMEEIKQNGQPSLIDNTLSLINDIFFGESTWVSQFN